MLIKRPILKKLSKFSRITFPVVGLYHVPQHIVTPDTIRIIKQDGQEEIIDKFGPDSFINRLVSVDSEFYFEITALNLSQLISSEAVWIIDAEAKIHNLSKKSMFEARSERIVRVGDGVCWVSGISYPFEVKKHLIDPKLLLQQFATVVHIDREWVLYEFSAFKKPIKQIRL